MATATWNNGIGRRGREPRAAIVVADGSVHRYTGASIPGVCASAQTNYTKNAKWSNTDFEAVFAGTSTFVSWCQDWETGETFPQKSWDDAFGWLQAEAPQLRRDAFEAFVRDNWPERAETWDTYAAEVAQFGGEPLPPIIVTRHAGLVGWLAARGITGEVAEQATADIVRGRDVIGVLPLWLAVEARSITTVDLPRLPQGRRATELTAAEMDEYGATLRRYVVREAQSSEVPVDLADRYARIDMEAVRAGVVDACRRIGDLPLVNADVDDQIVSISGLLNGILAEMEASCELPHRP